MSTRRKRTRNAVKKAAGEVLIELRARKREGADVVIPTMRGDGMLGFMDQRTGMRRYISPSQVPI